MLTSKLARKNFFSLYLGNVVEHYSSALYSFLAPLFAEIFFPQKEYLSALILTYAILPLGMLAKPLGSLFFGFIGDSYGRKQALFLSLFGMSITTLFIGILPLYSQIGTLAPLFLLASRVLQSFFVAGENIGGAICLLESVEEKKKDFASGLYSTSTIAGIFLASAAVALLYHFQVVHQMWRLLYFTGALAALFTAILRKGMKAFVPVLQKSERVLWPHLKGIWEMRREVICLTFASGFSYATYSIIFVLMNGLVPLVSTITKGQVALFNAALLLFDFATLPLFGLLANRFSRVQSMKLAAFSAAVTGAPLFTLLENSTVYLLMAIRICFVLIGVWFSATYHSWSQSLIPRTHRYTLISFSHAIGSQLLGSPASAISLWLYQQTGVVVSASFYWVLLAAITGVIMLRSEVALKQQYA